MTIMKRTAAQQPAYNAGGDDAETQEPPPSGRTAILDAASFFRLSHWSQNSLSINAKGHLSLDMGDTHVDLFDIAKTLNQSKQWPVLLRFPALITKNIAAIQQAFQAVIARTNYKNSYTLAYPLKVNPHKSVVKTMMQSAYAKNMSFEVGSKAELLIALTQTQHDQRIMCNGFKDIDYITLVLVAAKSGQALCLVFETVDEVYLLNNVLQLTKQDLPKNLYLGLRLRLSSPVEGHWEDSNGQHSKFGLSSAEALSVITLLKNKSMLSHLRAMHIHPGSQILALSELSSCFNEAIRYYHELLTLGVPLKFVDIGGGLGMDYSGASQEKLRNYTLEDYAAAMIEPMGRYCNEHDLPHPHIISETGRNTVALSSLLLTNIQPLGEHNDTSQTTLKKPDNHVSISLNQLWELHQFIISFSSDELVEATYAQLDILMNNIREEFLARQLSLADLAWAENMYHWTQKQLQGPAGYQKYIANFSVFQSMPDYWGIQQFFPMLSLHGYENPLTRSGVFYDLTCDSDGVVKHYLHPETLQTQLRMPNCTVQFMGIFLMGAYQEIMASGHNLFERLPCLDVVFNETTKSLEMHAYEACNMGSSLSAIGYDLADITQQSAEKFEHTTTHPMIVDYLDRTSYLSTEETKGTT